MLNYRGESIIERLTRAMHVYQKDKYVYNRLEVAIIVPFCIHKEDKNECKNDRKFVSLPRSLAYMVQ